MHDSAAAIDSVNTIVNEDGDTARLQHRLPGRGKSVARAELQSGNFTVAVAGSGGMAKAVVAALRDERLPDVTVVARNTVERDGRWRSDTASPGNPISVRRPADLLVNATPIGMAGGPDADGHAVHRSRSRGGAVPCSTWSRCPRRRH